MKAKWILCLALGLLCHGAQEALGLDPAIDGVMSLTPVAENSAIAVQLDAPSGTAITGIRWYNNDGSAVFPKIEFVGSNADGTPNLQDVQASVSNVDGSSLGWSELELGTFVPAGDDPLFAVFYLPAFQERTDSGVGGGPGLGYFTESGGRSAYLASELGDLVAVSSRIQLAVEAVTAESSAAKRAADGAMSARTKEQFQTGLLPPTPNPANPATGVRFSLAQRSELVLIVYNQRGARVRELYRGSLPAGEHLLRWRGDDESRREVASGVYFIRMQVRGDGVYSQRVTVVR